MKKEKLNYMEKINKKVIFGEDLNDEEVGELLNYLQDKDKELVIKAASILTLLESEVLLKILEIVPKLGPDVKEGVLSLLAVTDCYEVYKFLFKILKESDLDDLSDLIVLLLSKTHYFIFPIILSQLVDASAIYKYKIKKLLLNLGKDKVFPYLGMFPEMPFESFFRDVFGDEDIDKLIS
jgi:hypothetical protein